MHCFSFLGDFGFIFIGNVSTTRNDMGYQFGLGCIIFVLTVVCYLECGQKGLHCTTVSSLIVIENLQKYGIGLCNLGHHSLLPRQYCSLTIFFLKHYDVYKYLSCKDV